MNPQPVTLASPFVRLEPLITASGRVRDTVSFSIVDSEWPAVRCKLDARLARSDLAASSPAAACVPAALHPTP